MNLCVDRSHGPAGTAKFSGVRYPASRGMDSFFPAARSAVVERRAALHGRATELRELERAYALARDEKQAQTVTLVGATGMGKTRLVRDFLVKMRDEPAHAPRVFRGTAREGGPAYEVFARALRARFGLVEGMDAEAAKAQVRAQVAAVLDDRKVGDVAYFFGQLLDLRFQDSPLIKAVEGDPQPMRAMRRAVIKSFLETDAAKGAGPLVLVFDELQWAQDDSLDLLSYLVESLQGPHRCSSAWGARSCWRGATGGGASAATVTRSSSCRRSATPRPPP